MFVTMIMCNANEIKKKKNLLQESEKQFGQMISILVSLNCWPVYRQLVLIF